VRFVDVPESNDGPRIREPVTSVLGPLDEGDGAVEVRLQVAPLLGIESGDPVQVEVRDRRRSLVTVSDRERRAGDGARHPERSRRPAHERGLPGAQVARDRDDIARGEAFCETSSKRLRLVRRRGHDLHEREG
jgi:hypothetical protein